VSRVKPRQEQAAQSNHAIEPGAYLDEKARSTLMTTETVRCCLMAATPSFAA